MICFNINTLEFILTGSFWLIATIGSALYGFFAIRIFFKKEDVEASKQNHLSWKIHQWWLNFLGSFLGWIILYYLLKKVQYYDLKNLGFDYSFEDLLLTFFSFVGITGHLPSMIVSIVGSFALLLSKLFEFIKNWLTKKIG